MSLKKMPHPQGGVVLEKQEKVKNLLKQLKSFSIPDLLLDKVRQQQQWSHSGTALAFEEYLRFIALSSISERVVPSLAIDEIWHTHLTFTRNYWEGMCQTILNYPLHHEPSGLVPNAKDKNDYQITLDLYEKVFEEIPPPEVWGRNCFLALKNTF